MERIKLKRTLKIYWVNVPRPPRCEEYSQQDTHGSCLHEFYSLMVVGEKPSYLFKYV